MAGLVIAHDDAVAPRAWAGLGIVAGASFVTSLDALVLYVAFGAIHRDFPHIGAPALSWVLSGYTIVIAAGMIAAGRWADRLGRRRVFLGGTCIFTVASAACAVARPLEPALAATTVTVSGAGHMIPITHPAAVVDAVRRAMVARNRSQGART